MAFHRVFAHSASAHFFFKVLSLVLLLRHLPLKLKDNKLSPDLKYDLKLDYMLDIDSMLRVHVEIKLFFNLVLLVELQL